MSLVSKTCVPCEGGASPLHGEAIAQLMQQLSPQWRVIDKKITRTLAFKNFKEAIKFVNKIADIAEHEGHHPDIAIRYNKVEITLWTHAIGGLSDNDFIVAAKIDTL